MVKCNLIIVEQILIMTFKVIILNFKVQHQMVLIWFYKDLVMLQIQHKEFYIEIVEIHILIEFIEKQQQMIQH